MKDKVSVKIVRDDKKEFNVDGVIWGIPSDGMVGFDTVDFEMFNEPQANGNGDRDEGGRVGSKDRTIRARLKNPALNDVMRKVVVSFFNPLHSFKIYVTYMDCTRWCEGKRVAFSCPTENIYKPIEFMVTFRSVMPYMLSVDDFNKDIATLIPLAGFPYMCSTKTGYATGAYKFAKEVIIENDGDVSTYARCILTATGRVENPRLIKGDKFVKINDVLENGDVYEFEFDHIPPRVKKNGVNAIGKVDKTSSLIDMGFDVGQTKIAFDADVGSTMVKVLVIYNKRYMGV